MMINTLKGIGGVLFLYSILSGVLVFSAVAPVLYVN